MKTYDMSLVTKKIYESRFQLFSLKTLAAVLEISENSSAFKVINRLIGSGVLTKIERGKYMPANYAGGEFQLANFMYQPSYISFETALSQYGILSQFPYEVTSATIQQARTKEFDGKVYGYYRIQKGLFWGYVKEGGYLIAEPEKALADQVYLAAKGLKKVHFDEYDLESVDKKKLKLYLSKYPQTRQFRKAVTKI